MSYSTPGAGTSQHLSMEFMAQRFGLKMTHVPYRSSPQSIADIAAGHVNLGFAEAGASLPLIRDGKLRALAVSSLARLPTLPDVPPFGEAAGAPDFEAVSWHILLAPAATPKEIIDRLHQEMKRIMSAPDMKKRASDIGLLPLNSPPVEGIRAIHQVRAGQVGLAGEKAGARRLAVDRRRTADDRRDRRRPIPSSVLRRPSKHTFSSLLPTILDPSIHAGGANRGRRRVSWYPARLVHVS